MQVTFQTKKLLAPNVWEFTFTPAAPVEYVAGQYARFSFPFLIDDSRGKQHRTFSFTSHPSESQLRFIVRLEAPLSVFKQPLSTLKPGGTMYIDEPRGDSILPRISNTPLLFVAQGIAIASFVSIFQEIIGNHLLHPVSFFWAHRPEDAVLDEQIPEGMQFASHVERTYPNRLNARDIIVRDTPGSLIYLSGSRTFVEMMGADIESLGVPRERIIYDYYEGYTEL